MPDSNRSHRSDRSHGFRPSRREVLALGVGAFVVAAIPLAAGRRRRLVRRSIPVMGTIAEFAIVHDDERTAQAAIDAAIRALRFVDRTMTRFADTSDVGRVNLRAATEATRVCPETCLVIEEAVRWAEATDGAFDPCLGRASEAWDVTRRRTPPPDDALVRLGNRALWRALDVDTWRGEPAVKLGDRHAALDLGGIAKGYGVDRAAAALREKGIENALVNVGGDLYALGASEDGDPWKVGIRSPADASRLVGSIEVRDEAVATSGDYERFFRHGGRTYHHLLDPATAAPRQVSVHSVSVTAPTGMAADAGATAAFGMSREAAEAALARVAPGARIVSTS